MSDKKGQILRLPTVESATPADRRSKAARDLDSYGDDVAILAAEPWVEDSERPKLRDLAAILHVIAADVRAGWPISDLLAAARLAAMPWTKPTPSVTAAAVQLVERVDDADTVVDIDPRDATGEPEIASPENPCRVCGARPLFNKYGDEADPHELHEACRVCGGCTAPGDTTCEVDHERCTCGDGDRLVGVDDPFDARGDVDEVDDDTDDDTDDPEGPCATCGWRLVREHLDCGVFEFGCANPDCDDAAWWCVDAWKVRVAAGDRP